MFNVFCTWLNKNTKPTVDIRVMCFNLIHILLNFERGFIRAETIAYDDFVTLGGEQPAKEAGKMRAEGKGYIVKDGDVMHILFNT